MTLYATIGAAIFCLLLVAIGLVLLSRGRRPEPTRQAIPDRAALVGRVADLEAQLPAVVRRINELDEHVEGRFKSLAGQIARGRRGQAEEMPATAPTLVTESGERVLTPDLARQLGLELPREATGTDHHQAAPNGFPPLPPPRSRRFGR